MIQGVRSSDSPQGRISSRLRYLPRWNPYSDAGLIVFKAAFPIFPEPEIYFPAGTDLRIKLTEPTPAVVMEPKSSLEPSRASAIDQTENSEFKSLAQSLPQHCTMVKPVAADVVNLVFVGLTPGGGVCFPASWFVSSASSYRRVCRPEEKAASALVRGRCHSETHKSRGKTISS